MLQSIASIRRAPVPCALVLSMASLLGCGDGATAAVGGAGGASGDVGGGGDAGAGAGGSNTSFTPAKHGAPPQVVSSGGPVLQYPRVKAIYYADNPDQSSQLDDFLSKLAVSSYWAKLSSEYGFGELGVGQSVHRATKGPATLSESMLLTELSQELMSASPTWGPPSASTIYTFIIPSGTKFLGGGLCCANFAGYHSETTVGSTKIPYAVVCECPDAFPDLSGTDQLSLAMAHEIIEAAANPYTGSAPAFQQTDNDHAVWTYLTNGEVADLCEFEKGVLAHPSDIGFGVPRVWSNKAALAGTDPCTPALAGAYFNSAPEQPDTVTIHFYEKDWQTKGISIPQGGKKTINVHLFSDGPTAPWTLEAFPSASGSLKLTWDQSSGQNGDVRKLTIEVLQAAPGNGGEPFYIKSTLGETSHLWMGVVGN